MFPRHSGNGIGSVSDILARWPFVRKHGSRKEFVCALIWKGKQASRIRTGGLNKLSQGEDMSDGVLQRDQTKRLICVG